MQQPKMSLLHASLVGITKAMLGTGGKRFGVQRDVGERSRGFSILFLQFYRTPGQKKCQICYTMLLSRNCV